MLYIIGKKEDWQNAPVKIGYTESSPESRLSSIQTGNPLKLIIVHIMEGLEQDEKQIHRLLRKFRLNGEWFDTPKIPERILELIISCNTAIDVCKKIEGLLLEMESSKTSNQETFIEVESTTLIESNVVPTVELNTPFNIDCKDDGWIANALIRGEIEHWHVVDNDGYPDPSDNLLGPLTSYAGRIYGLYSRGSYYMADLFHENIPDVFIEVLFTIMSSCPESEFIIKSKYINRMVEYIQSTNKAPLSNLLLVADRDADSDGEHLMEVELSEWRIFKEPLVEILLYRFDY